MIFLVRTLESLLYPVGLVWALLTIGGIILYRKKLRRPAFFCLGLSAYLYLAGATPIPEWLLARLEKPFADLTIENATHADAIVVLGGIMNSSAHDAFGLSVTSAADRIVTGVELMRQKKAGALVVGGGPTRVRGDTRSEGLRVEAWIKTWNVAPGEVIGLDACLNTHQEAERVRALMTERKWTNVILVTSASHMPRALATFEKVGVAVRPVACDFDALAVMEGESPGFKIVPVIEHLQSLSLYLHEVVGWIYYACRGWV